MHERHETTRATEEPGLGDDIRTILGDDPDDTEDDNESDESDEAETDEDDVTHEPDADAPASRPS
jgi:hypothetical protein